MRYVFKDFPLTNIHPQAVKAAEAARCAGEQDQRLAMYRQLFETQGEWSGRSDAPALFKGYAADLGLDKAFSACLDSERLHRGGHGRHGGSAGLGVTGTPAFILNGRPLSGAQPYEIFDKAIHQLLAEQAG